MRARRASVGIDGQGAIARSFMVLSFAAAGLLVLTHEPAPERIVRNQPSPAAAPPPASATPTQSTAAPAPAPAAQQDQQNSEQTAAPAIAAAPLPNAPAISAAVIAEVQSQPVAPSVTPASAPSPAAQPKPESAARAVELTPRQAIAALATGILPQPARANQSAVRPQPSASVAESPPRPSPGSSSKSGFVAAQSVRETLQSIPLNAPRLVVDLSDRQVYFYHGDQLKASYTVAIGQDGWETPQGSFRVIDRQKHPLWEHPITKERIGNDPRNPLGTRWISFWTDGVHSIGFHGTNRDDSVGQAVSHGCLRMRNGDIEVLYDEVQMGTPVVVRE